MRRGGALAPEAALFHRADFSTRSLQQRKPIAIDPTPRMIPKRSCPAGLIARAAASTVAVICQRRALPTGTPAGNLNGPETNILPRFVCSATARKSILESCSRLRLATAAFPPAHLVRLLRLLRLFRL